MKVLLNGFGGFKVLMPKLHKDSRGFFYEAFNNKKFSKILKKNFLIKQINVSFSKKNVFRGFHYQAKPFSQDKVIRVLEGEILDIIISLNKKEKHYLQKFSTKLSAQNKKILYIPGNFAHGFLVLSKTATIEYLTSSNYSKKHERTLFYNGPKINYKLPKKIIISNKDTYKKSLY
jgi:dTDP-4-dehydrorhamnose 3,5-epimerase